MSADERRRNLQHMPDPYKAASAHPVQGEAREEDNESRKVTKMMGDFHWRDGWHFRRIEGGMVLVRHIVMHEGQPVADQTLEIPPNEWISIVAAVSESGSTASSYKAAGAAHAN